MHPQKGCQKLIFEVLFYIGGSMFFLMNILAQTNIQPVDYLLVAVYLIAAVVVWIDRKSIAWSLTRRTGRKVVATSLGGHIFHSSFEEYLNGTEVGDAVIFKDSSIHLVAVRAENGVITLQKPDGELYTDTVENVAARMKDFVQENWCGYEVVRKKFEEARKLTV
jgi:hypothetical protein